MDLVVNARPLIHSANRNDPRGRGGVRVETLNLSQVHKYRRGARDRRVFAGRLAAAAAFGGPAIRIGRRRSPERQPSANVAG